MNKKIIFGTWLGTIIGGSLLACSDIYRKMNNHQQDFDIDSGIAVFSGAFSGSLLGFFLSLLWCNNEEQTTTNEIYREFFESQQIITNPNSDQVRDETTPLLSEHHITEINSQQLVHNNDNSANSAVMNFHL